MVQAAFPFHFAVDGELRLLQVGDALRRVYPGLAPGDDLSARFALLAPDCELRSESLIERSRSLFLLTALDAELTLRGQMLANDDCGQIFFLGFPWVTDTDQVAKLGISVSDFPIHNPIVDYLVLLQAKSAALTDAKVLAERLSAAAHEQARLAEAERHLARELRAIPGLMLRIDRQGKILELRPDPEMEATGNSSELLGSNAYETFPRLGEPLRHTVESVLATRVAQSFEYGERRADHERRFEARVVASEFNEAVVLVRDVTERFALERQLAHHAFHDPLTGLPNRGLLRMHVEEALACNRDEPGEVAVLFVDLDNFKLTNDLYGHICGDELLVVVSERMRAGARPGDTVARLGGDEFGILLAGGGVECARIVARRLLETLGKPVALGGKPVRVSVSIGIATAADAAGVDGILADADVAMYAAKAAGKGRYQVFQPEMHERRSERHDDEAELRRGVDLGQLRLVYQPIVDLKTEMPVGFEAFIRWQHPTKGVIPPQRFLPLAEKAGLIGPIGEWVLSTACRQLRAWRDAYPDLAPDSMTVNLSARQLSDPRIVGQVEHALHESSIPAGRLILDIPEGVFLANEPWLGDRLHQLRGLGVRIALDDFGTAYASLAGLGRRVVDLVKVDTALVAGTTAGPNDPAIAAAVIEFCRALGVETIAESVEFESQLAPLRALNCTFGQGYKLGPPLAADTIEAEFSRRGSAPA